MENNMDRYLGQMLDNRYELLEVIGSGGMAIVYKALCHRLNRYVAVKILKDEFAEDAEFKEHFKAESQAVAMLSHPNIVSVYDFSKSSDCQYIVMELLEGITLKQYMQKKGALSWKEALHFSTQIAKALSHAHSKGIIHRDIKPQNIMVVKDGSIKVADFGIAHLQSETLTDPSETIGSIHYISPEQARGEPVDARSDIYSLGVVMYEMLTGQLPYDGSTVESIAVQHLSAMLVLPGDINPEIPLGLEEITLRALRADIGTRYQSAEELQDDLENFRKQQTAGAAEGLDDDLVTSAGVISDNNSPVRPLGRTGEMTKSQYARRKVRSRKVSTFTGIGLVSIFLLAIVGFLWNYWIEDIFVDGNRIEIPSFVGQDSNEISNSSALQGTYKFKISYTIDPDLPEGQVISQKPEAGRSVMLTKDKILIELTVSTGILMTKIPDVVNQDSRTASITLEKLGFKVETEIVASQTITSGQVVSSQPVAGESLPAGSTVYLQVSGGPELIEVAVTNLLGMQQGAALAEITRLKLELGTVTEVENSSYAKGEVCWQSLEAGGKVSQGSTIYLQISAGPKSTPEPSPTATAEPSSPSVPPETLPPVVETPSTEVPPVVVP